MTCKIKKKIPIIFLLYFSLWKIYSVTAGKVFCVNCLCHHLRLCSWVVPYSCSKHWHGAVFCYGQCWVDLGSNCWQRTGKWRPLDVLKFLIIFMLFQPSFIGCVPPLNIHLIFSGTTKSGSSYCHFWYCISTCWNPDTLSSRNFGQKITWHFTRRFDFFLNTLIQSLLNLLPTLLRF